MNQKWFQRKKGASKPVGSIHTTRSQYSLIGVAHMGNQEKVDEGKTDQPCGNDGKKGSGNGKNVETNSTDNEAACLMKNLHFTQVDNGKRIPPSPACNTRSRKGMGVMAEQKEKGVLAIGDEKEIFRLAAFVTTVTSNSK